MDEWIKQYVDMLIRVDRMGRTYTDSHGRASAALENFRKVRAAVAEIKKLMRVKPSGTQTAQGPTVSKAVARARIMTLMGYIEQRAFELSLETEDEEGRYYFDMTWNRDDQDLLAQAQDFAQRAMPLRDELVSPMLPETFIEDLQAAMAYMNKALAERNRLIKAGQLSAIALDDALDQGLWAVRVLGVIMGNRRQFHGDWQTYRTWLRASFVGHLIRYPKWSPASRLRHRLPVRIRHEGNDIGERQCLICSRWRCSS